MSEADSSSRWPSLCRWLGFPALVVAVTEMARVGRVLFVGDVGLFLWSGLALLAVAALAERRGPQRPLFRAAWFLALVGVVVVLQLPLDAWIQRQPRFPALGTLLVPLLSPFHAVGMGPGGELETASSEGALSFALTAELVGLRVWVTFAVAAALTLWHERSLRPRQIVSLLVIVLGACSLQVGYKVLRFLSIDQVLTQGHPSMTMTFSLGREALVASVAAALLLHLCSGRSPRLTATEPAAWTGPRRRLAWVLLLVGTLGGVTAASIHSRGAAKSGRVLVDDRLSDIWEPAARRLDHTWFGDMSTYSLSSLVEFLGYHFATTVNVSERYTDALLEDFDVLVLKTPRLWIEEPEEAAILRFVERGGGLLLIGDHTNLMGMGTKLNRLARHAGLQFRFDSVVSAHDGGFSLWRRPQVRPHPATGSASAIEFMTGCSVQVAGGAEPLLVVPDQVRIDHDYSRGSFFGGIKSDPRMDHGPLALAGAGRYGQGRMLAFGDSTILSSFGAFSWDRERLFLGLVDFLNTRAGSETGRQAVVVAGSLAALLGLWWLRRAGRGEVALGLALAAWVAVPAGLAWAQRVDAAQYPEVEPAAEVPRLAVLLADCEAVFAPVIGSVADFDLDWSHDSHLAAIPRSGVFPRLCTTWDEALADQAVLVLNPRTGPVAGGPALPAWVEEGGDLLLAVRSDHLHVEAINGYLEPLGLTATVDESGQLALDGSAHGHLPDGSRIWVRDHGLGTVVLVQGSENWSRERIGHCFDVPAAEQRARYQSLDLTLRQLPGLVPDQRRTYAIRGGPGQG